MGYNHPNNPGDIIPKKNRQLSEVMKIIQMNHYYSGQNRY